MKTGKNMKILLVISVVLLIAFSGCTAKNEQTIKSPSGDVKVSVGQSGPDWCKAGTTMTTTSPDGKQVSYAVKGITTYEGKEVCESGWSSKEGSYTIYTGADGTYNVMIMRDASGKETKIDMSQPKK